MIPIDLDELKNKRTQSNFTGLLSKKMSLYDEWINMSYKIQKTVAWLLSTKYYALHSSAILSRCTYVVLFDPEHIYFLVKHETEAVDFPLNLQAITSYMVV